MQQRLGCGTRTGTPDDGVALVGSPDLSQLTGTKWVSVTEGYSLHDERATWHPPGPRAEDAGHAGSQKRHGSGSRQTAEGCRRRHGLAIRLGPSDIARWIDSSRDSPPDHDDAKE